MNHFQNRDLFCLLLGASETIIWVLMLKEKVRIKDNPVPRVILPGNYAGLEVWLVQRPQTWAKFESDIQTLLFGMSGICIFFLISCQHLRIAKFYIKISVPVCLEQTGKSGCEEPTLPCGSRQLFPSCSDPFEWDSPSPVHHNPHHSLLSPLPAYLCLWPAPSPPVRSCHLYELEQELQTLRMSYTDRKFTDNLG